MPPRVTFEPKAWIALVSATLVIVTTIVGTSIAIGGRLASIEENTARNAKQDRAIEALADSVHDLERIVLRMDGRLGMIETHLGVHEREVR